MCVLGPYVFGGLNQNGLAGESFHPFKIKRVTVEIGEPKLDLHQLRKIIAENLGDFFQVFDSIASEFRDVFFAPSAVGVL